MDEQKKIENEIMVRVEELEHDVQTKQAQIGSLDIKLKQKDTRI